MGKERENKRKKRKKINKGVAMPGDIRSFFGGKKSTKKDASPSPTENKSSKMNTMPQIAKKTTPITSPLKKKKESVSKRKRVLMDDDDDEYDVKVQEMK